MWGKKKTKSEIMPMNLNGFAYIKDTSIGLSGKSDMAISYLFVCVWFFLKQEKHLNASQPPKSCHLENRIQV